MPLLTFKDIGISGIAAAVPENRVNNYHCTDHFPESEVKKIVDRIGIYERRFADEQTCSSDLCYAAAVRLLADMNLDPSEIDGLLFVSQTPDYRMPATAFLLQERLNLGSSTIAFDINLGCSGFLVGLQTAYALLSNPGMSRILLLNGETRSKVYSPKDRKTAFLFGDAGSAAIIEKGEKFGHSYFSLNSSGAGASMIHIKAGGYRVPSSEETRIEKVADEYGNIRSDEHGYMDGENVFSFVAKEVPADLEKLYAYADARPADTDFFLFHQASRIVNEFLVKKIGLDKMKVPSSLHHFGNTSSVSIPLTIVTELRDKLKPEHVICLSAFGVGLSWGSGLIQPAGMTISELTEV